MLPFYDRWFPQFRHGWLLLAGLILPIITLTVGGVGGTPPSVAATFGVLVLGTVFGRCSPRSRSVSFAAVLAVAAGGLMVPQATYPGAVYVLSGLLALGIGLLLPRPSANASTSASRSFTAIAVLTVGAALVALHLANATLSYLALVALAVPVPFTLPNASRPAKRLVAIPIASLLLMAAVGGVCWVGATSPRAAWFGALIWHGPRDSGFVAITFDDGPNGEYTLEIASILEAYNARGTFFEVGRAVEQQPDVTKTLVARGHIVGNHSFRHSNYGFLRPGYPELEATQRAIARATALCPALYRPPHGTHTPILSRIVNNAGLEVVTWDVSAQDWARVDADGLATDVLSKARSGSIILLHDGLDGRPGVDRSVVPRALPAILDGLEKKGLKVVPLDQLLGISAYQAAERCTGP